MRRLLPILALLCFALPAYATAGAPPVQTCVNRAGAATTITCTFGVNFTVGNLVAVIFHENTNATATVTSVIATGCTSTTFAVTTHSPAVYSTVMQAWAYMAPNSGGGCKVITVTFNGSVTAGIMGVEYSGMATSSPVDCDAAANGIEVSGVYTSGSCSTSNANDTVFIGFSINADPSPSTAGGSYAKVVDESTGGTFWGTSENLNVTSTGSKSGTMSALDNAAHFAAMLVAIKQAGGGGVVRHRASVINQ